MQMEMLSVMGIMNCLVLVSYSYCVLGNQFRYIKQLILPAFTGIIYNIPVRWCRYNNMHDIVVLTDHTVYSACVGFTCSCLSLLMHGLPGHPLKAE